MTRTENSTKNMFTGLINQVLTLIFRFLTRTILIRYLGKEFLGINGLFSNILTVLSLADLGLSGALIYGLYKPIAEKDYKKQVILVNFLKKAYRVIGLIILGIGILILPFLSFIIKDNVTIINIYLVFLIYLFQTASTYLFFASKAEFLNAQQKSYVNNNISNIVIIVSNIVQIIVLIVFRNFYLYLLTILAFTIIQAYFISRKAKSMFPYINEKNVEELSKDEKKTIFKDCGSLMIYRINYVILTATDNIVISKYLGLAVVGLYSNYLLITNSIVNLLSIFFNSINASIGNLNVASDKDRNLFIFKLVNIITVTLFGISSIAIYVLIDDFIVLWVGKEFLLSASFVIIISINLYVEGLRKFLSTYRSSYGLFRQAKFIPIMGAISNIIISIILVQKIGIFGVLLGTLISNVISFMWYDPYLIYRHVFKKNVLSYYAKNILYLALFASLAFVCKMICGLIPLHGILGLFVHGIICLILPLIVIILIYYKSSYYEYMKDLTKRFLNRKKLQEVK